MTQHRYRFYWRDGSVSEGYGLSAADALNQLGCGAGAVPALDHWEKFESSYPGYLRIKEIDTRG